MRFKNKEFVCFQFSDTYLIPLLVCLFSSADNDIQYWGKQASYKISWKTQPKLLQKHTSIMRPVSKHKRATQHVGYNRSCHNTSKSLPWIVCRCNAMYKTTNTFNDKPLHLHVMSCCKQAWGRKMKKKYTITIGMDLNSDIMGRLLWLIWAKEALFFCRSFFLFVCSLLLQYFKRYCVFLQVYKWAPLFLESIMSRAGYPFNQKQYIKA